MLELEHHSRARVTALEQQSLLFSCVWCTENPPGRIQTDSDTKQVWNFKDIMSSMMLLFRISTGDSWFPIIYDASIVHPHCTDWIYIACDSSCDADPECKDGKLLIGLQMLRMLTKAGILAPGLSHTQTLLYSVCDVRVCACS